MKREIKFRAWDVQKKQMIMPDMSEWTDLFIELDGGIYQAKEYGYERTILKDSVSNVPLMQFTGLTDKNGVEVYEGDVIEKQGKKYRVYWKGSAASFACRQLDTTGAVYHLNKKRTAISEIIGNIHQNPELLTP